MVSVLMDFGMERRRAILEVLFEVLVIVEVMNDRIVFYERLIVVGEKTARSAVPNTHESPLLSLKHI